MLWARYAFFQYVKAIWFIALGGFSDGKKVNDMICVLSKKLKEFYAPPLQVSPNRYVPNVPKGIKVNTAHFYKVRKLIVPIKLSLFLFLKLSLFLF